MFALTGKSDGEFDDNCSEFIDDPKGLSSSGDHFNSTTNQFLSWIGQWLIKHVDNMYIQATGLEKLEARLEIATGEAEKHGCTWSISKFFAGRDTNIVSGHQVVLDPSGERPPQIGPDPSRIEKLTHMQPPKNIKEV